MAKKPRRIPEQNVFVKRKLTKEVRTLTVAKVPPRDHRKIKRHVTTRHRDIRTAFGHNYRKLNDRNRG